MFFDYQDWRCQLRDKKITPKGPVIGPGGLLRPAQFFEPYIKTEVWFYHFCVGPHDKKHKASANESLPPLHNGKPRKHSGWQWKNGYLAKFCQRCGAEASFEVLDYFAKALELWRLSAP